MEWERVKREKEEVEKKRAHYYQYHDAPQSRVLTPCSYLFCCMYGSILPDSETALKPALLLSRISQEWVLVTPVAELGLYSGPEAGFDIAYLV